MKKIAITGGIGSGKSTVCAILKEKGYPVYSCDEIYKKIILSKEYVEKVRVLFPTAVENGMINKSKLAAFIFQNVEAKKQLEDVAHPLIMSALHSAMGKVTNQIVFAEVPLLFEGNYEAQFDGILVILREREDRIADVILRDKLTREQVLNRMIMQIDYDSKDMKNRFAKMGAYIISNNGSLQTLKNEVEKYLKIM